MALEPVDYSIQGVPSPFQSLASGYQIGAGIRDDQAQQAALQQAQQAQAAQQQALIGLINNPQAGAKDYAAFTLLMPKLKDQLQQSWTMKNAAQQESMLRDVGQYYSAASTGRADIAVKMMQARADAMERAGASPQEIQGLRTQAQILEAHPEYGRTMMGVTLASLPGGDKVLAGISTAGTEQRSADKAPAELAKANAEANITGVEAANAPTKTALANANAAEDIETKKAQREIAALDTQIKQANSETQRGELILKRDELVQKQAEAATAKAATAQSKLDKIEGSLATVNSIWNHPGLEAIGMNGRGRPGLGGVGTYTGKVAGIIPGSDRKDLQGLVDTLQAQQFLTGIQNLVGMGALSNAEGEKIGSAVASLDLDQSAGAFKNALGVIKTNLEKAQRTAIASGSAPTAGGAFVLKSPRFGNVTEGDINRLMASQPGSTREQVLQYLQSTGGK